ncbi:MAG: PQQ-binding-like beta-propeller repeat protein [Planctomycetota bacterium]
MPRAVPASSARRRLRTASRAVAFFVLLWPSASAIAQLDDVFESDFYRPTAFLDERDRTILELLEKVEDALDEERWRDAAENLQDLLSTPGTQNAAFGERTYRDARLEARGRLLNAPAAVHEIYRALFEPRAREQLEAMAGERRPEAWRAIAAEYPLTDSAKTALRWLAGLSFERAEYASAAHWCQRLDELARAEGGETPAPVLARWLVSLAELGASSTFDRLARRIVAADDRREVPVAGTERSLLEMAESLEPKVTRFEPSLKMFRASGVAHRWTHELTNTGAFERDKSIPVASVAGSRLIVHSANGARAIDLASGKAVWSVDASVLMDRPIERALFARHLGIAVDEENVYLVRSEQSSAQDQDDHLICLSLETGELRWRRGGPEDIELTHARLCRQPASHQGQLFVSAIFGATPLEAKLLTLDAASGEIAWSRFLAAGRPLVSGDRFSTVSPDLVQPGDPVVGTEGVFVLTNLGVLTCIDPWEERILWSFHYSRVRDVRSLPPEKIGYFEVRPWREGELQLRPNDLLVAPSDSEWAYALTRRPDAEGRVMTAEPLFKAPSSLRALVGVGEDIVLFEQFWQKRFRLAAYSTDLSLEWVSMPLSAKEELVGPPLVTGKQVIYATGRRLYFLDLERDGSLVHIQSAPGLEADTETDVESFESLQVAGDLLITLSRRKVTAWSPK